MNADRHPSAFQQFAGAKRFCFTFIRGADREPELNGSSSSYIIIAPLLKPCSAEVIALESTGVLFGVKSLDSKGLVDKKARHTARHLAETIQTLLVGDRAKGLDPDMRKFLRNAGTYFVKLAKFRDQKPNEQTTRSPTSKQAQGPMRVVAEDCPDPEVRVCDVKAREQLLGQAAALFEQIWQKDRKIKADDRRFAAPPLRLQADPAKALQDVLGSHRDPVAKPGMTYVPASATNPMPPAASQPMRLLERDVIANIADNPRLRRGRLPRSTRRENQ